MWDERYAQPGFAYGTDPNEFSSNPRAASFPPAARSSAWPRVRGETPSFWPGGVQGHRGRRLGGGPREGPPAGRGARRAIRTVVADLADFDLGVDRWDAIVSIGCHTAPDLRARLHRAAVQALRPGGVFVLEAYRPEQVELKTGGPPTAELLVTLAAVGKELTGLDLLVGAETLREVHEGRNHQGRSAVLQVVARRRAAPPDAGRSPSS